MAKKKALTKKQKAFVEEYLKCWNATEAARRAEYKGSNVTLASVGYENIRKPQIAQLIDERFAEMVMSANETLARLSEQSRAEYSQYIEERDGQAYIDLKAMKRDGKMRLIKNIRETKYGQQVEFYDAQTALVNIAKHHKLLTDRHELTGKDGGPIPITTVEVLLDSE